MTSASELRLKLCADAFRMPSVQTMMSRKSSITNAFVCAVIPRMPPPTAAEIDEALRILDVDPADVKCVYCGSDSTEWDHLRPLVMDRRPTGYVSEISNLVPACGKCNQSKGNKPWRSWMLSKTRLSPAGKQVKDLMERIARLEAFEQWRVPRKVDFEALLGADIWQQYWELCDRVVSELQAAQTEATAIRNEVEAALSVNS